MPSETQIESRIEATSGLVELLDKLIGGGAVIDGGLVVTLAGIDLLFVDLKLLLCPADKLLSVLAGPEATGNEE
jgi:hypothetical protein